MKELLLLTRPETTVIRVIWRTNLEDLICYTIWYNGWHSSGINSVFSDLSNLFRDVNLIKKVAIARGPVGGTSALDRGNVDKEVTNQYINDT